MSGTEPASGTVRCEHCLREVPLSAALKAEIDGSVKYFCCHGCLGVYELVHSASLDAFYEQRCQWLPGAPSFEKTDPHAFGSTIVKTENGCRIDLQLSGIRCASCVWLIEKYLSKQDGVHSVRVNYATNRAAIDWNPEAIGLDSILDTLHSLGYTARPVRSGGTTESLAREKQELLLRFGTASFFSMQLMLIVAALYAGFFQGIGTEYRLAFQLISWALATPVVLYSGYPFLAGALRSIRSLNPNMDLLVALGSLSAYLYSIAMIPLGGEVFFDTSAMIVTFILLGRFLEAGSRLKAGNAIVALAGLQPQEAVLVKENGERRTVSLDQVPPGSNIEIIPGAKIPLDATVIEGEAEINESMLTGESLPVMKRSGSNIFAGTVNGNGRLLARVTGNPGETLLACIIRTVEEAQSRRAPVQQLADRVAGYFVPAILLIALLTFVYRINNGSSTVTALMNAVSVLVIACPCALGLATPLAILTGSTAAGKEGVLIKGGDIFETVSKTTLVAFDKTGTITRGKPSITNIVDFGTTPDLLRYAASLESASEHPAGKAIAAGWNGKLLPVEAFRAFPGKGVSGILQHETWLAGSQSFMLENQVAITPELQAQSQIIEDEGKTVVMLARGTRPAGMIGLIDEIRDDLPELLSALRRRGMKIMMLTGDNPGVASRIAARCGITDLQAGLSPAGKASIIEKLKAAGETVMMVGDGINDAPALAAADTGVTLGSATGIALESAGVAVLTDRLLLVDTLFERSIRCFSIIRQNLAWAFLYNIAAVPLAVSGMLHPIVAALLMASSSLIVVGNSLRLQKTRT
ncbi:heavy metal translocating P-type ATPase [Chlorobium limicola]|uniref:P-type Cu(2+) transporter n=1 Tax=Chlorobium limicola TaxID=1092 RepID=A0A124G8W2_CHLLI|nr:heavy metal translocating P-type ATPase [Chlorobium limicola]KUL27250.1 ATPase P [Chlorobium limicola]